MNYLKITLVTIGIGLFNFVNAQAWEQLPMHGGGYVTGLIPHCTDENIVFARIDVAGIYKTTNGGNTWESVTKSISKSNPYHYYVRSFAIDSNNTENLYFLSGNAPYEHGGITNEWFLWQSSNGGNTWTKHISPIGISGNGQDRNAGETILVSPANPDILYVSGQPTYDWLISDWKTNSGLYQYQISTDTWTPLDSGILAKAWTTNLRFDPSDNDILYLSVTENTQFGAASTATGLWKYTISTGLLTQVYTNPVVEFDFDANGSDTIVAILPTGIDWTFDGGATWQGVIEPFGYNYNYFVKTHPTNSGHWFFGYWDAIYQNGLIETTDFGANFHEAKYNSGDNLTKVTYPAYANDNFQPTFGNATATLLFHPANLNHIYISDWYGIFKSTDGNLDLINVTADDTDNSNWTWQWQTQGIYNLVQLRVTKHPTEDKFYNCLADIGFYEGDIVTNSTVYQQTHPITSIYKVEFATDNSNIGYMVGKHHSNKGRIVKTIDGGTSWVEVNSNFAWGASYFETNNSSAITDIQVAHGSGDTLVVGIEKGSMTHQIFISTDGGVSYAPWDDNITSDLFKSWTATDKLLLDADGETFYVWHEASLYKRHLSDAQWTAMVNPNGTNWFAQVITDPSQVNTLYATQYGATIYKSIDGGSTWTTINTSMSRCTQIAISENGNMAVIDGHEANADKEQGLFFSDDSGLTWIEIGMTNHPTMVSGILFLNDNKLIGWSENTGSAVIDLIFTATKSAYENENRVIIYPNPSQYTFYINTLNKVIENVDFQLFNSTGQQMKVHFEIETNGLISVNINHLPKGIYFLKSEQLGLIEQVLIN